jgi:hypothetical protein
MRRKCTATRYLDNLKTLRAPDEAAKLEETTLD